MGAEVTDPALLAQLNGPEVTDPDLLAQLNGKPPAAAPQSALPSFSDFSRALSLTGRSVVKGALAIPLAAADFGVGARNLLTGSNYENATQTLDPILNRLYGKPESTTEKIADFGTQLAAGAAVPAPTMAAAPAAFVPQAQFARQMALQKANEAGYVVPPSMANPSATNRLLEGFSGKLKLLQESAMRNQGVTQGLGAKSVGQSADSTLTQGGLAGIRSEAHAAGYAPVEKFGQMAADDAYNARLDQIAQSSQGPSGSFPGIKGNEELTQTLQALKQPTFDSADAIAMTRFLRDKADESFASGKASVGRAYKDASKALEDVVERNLSNAGQNGQKMLADFRDARQLMAKTFTAGKSLVDEMGTISAPRFGAELARGKPLVGEQRTIAEFARAFPKSARVITEPHPSISPLDAYGSAIAAGASHSVAPLAIPLTRVGIREYLLSPAGQARGIQQVAQPSAFAGLPGADASLAMYVSDYLSR